MPPRTEPSAEGTCKPAAADGYRRRAWPDEDALRGGDREAAAAAAAESASERGLAEGKLPLGMPEGCLKEEEGVSRKLLLREAGMDIGGVGVGAEGPMAFCSCSRLHVDRFFCSHSGFKICIIEQHVQVSPGNHKCSNFQGPLVQRP